MQSMPKLYLGPGLSQRVHQALTRRLESFMAGASGSAVPAEMNTAENPRLPGAERVGDSGSEQGEHGHQDDHSKSPMMDREGEERERSRSPQTECAGAEPGQSSRNLGILHNTCNRCYLNDWSAQEQQREIGSVNQQHPNAPT